MSSEHPKHECGITGMFNSGKPVANDLFFSNIAQQNRGQETSGIAVVDEGGNILVHTGLGFASSVFTPEDIARLMGSIGVGHNRYGTTGGSSLANAQPFVMESDIGTFAFGHNGNVFNASEIKEELKLLGAAFNATSDSEVIAKLIAYTPGNTFLEKIKKASKKLKGSYSLVVATKDSLIGVRDPYGIWPLSLGGINGSGYMMASETNAIDKVGGKFIRDFNPGEVVIINENGITSDSVGREKESLCSFEYYYFSDPHSKLLGRRAENARFEMGRLLAQEHFLEADWVSAVPETSVPAAEGYAYESKIPIRHILLRNRWLGARTFIEPTQRQRENAADIKYGVLPEIAEGKSLNIIDDSIVRGTTTKRLVSLLRKAGARKINILITAPPIIEPCWLGVDTANIDELIAAKRNVEEIRQYIGADYLGFLSLEYGLSAIGDNLKDRVCTSCFTGKYQMQVPSKRDKFILE